MIALIERKIEGRIGRPMCVVSQGTLQIFVDFYVGHFPIELSRKIHFGLCIARIQMWGGEVISQKKSSWKGGNYKIPVPYIYIYLYIGRL